MSVENIVEKILDEARSDARTIAEEAERETARLTLQLEREEKELREAADKRIKTEAQQIVKSRTSSARLEARKRILGEKDMIMGEVYAEVRERILSFPEDMYLDFLKRLAITHAAGGDEKVMLSPKDASRLKGKLPEWEKEVAREIKKLRRDGIVAVSPQTREIEGGLVLSQGRTEINLSLGVIIDETKYDLEGEVTRILFGG